MLWPHVIATTCTNSAVMRPGDPLRFSTRRCGFAKNPHPCAVSTTRTPQQCEMYTNRHETTGRVAVPRRGVFGRPGRCSCARWANTLATEPNSRGIACEQHDRSSTSSPVATGCQSGHCITTAALAHQVATAYLCGGRALATAPAPPGPHRVSLPRLPSPRRPPPTTPAPQRRLSLPHHHAVLAWRTPCVCRDVAACCHEAVLRAAQADSRGRWRGFLPWSS